MRPLTPKQQRFVQEYLIDLNATQAAIRAGYSAKTATWIGPQLLVKAHVGQAIAERKDKRSAETGIDAKFVLAHLAEMMAADIQDIVNEFGKFKPLNEWPKIWRQMLQGCDVEEIFERSKDGGDKSWDAVGRVVKIKFIDRLKAIELIGRHVNIRAFEQPQQTINVNVSLADDLNAGRERARLAAINRTTRAVN